MAKPAARITDPTTCPMPGHGPKAIALVLPTCSSTVLQPRPKAMPETINGNMDQKIPAIQIDTLLNLIQALTSVFRVTTLGGHREFPMQAGEGKICPRNIGMELVRNLRIKTKLLPLPSS